jgi:hypothetical protein
MEKTAKKVIGSALAEIAGLNPFYHSHFNNFVNGLVSQLMFFLLSFLGFLGKSSIL